MEAMTSISGLCRFLPSGLGRTIRRLESYMTVFQSEDGLHRLYNEVIR